MALSVPGIGEAGEISTSSLEKLMVLSGISKQFAEYPEMVKAGAEQSRKGKSAISDANFKTLLKAIDKCFMPEEILGTISREIKNTVSESDAQELLSWYESDLGRTITQAEENASTPEAFQEMVQRAQILLADEQRVRFAEKLDGILKATEMMMQLQENSALAAFTAVSKVMNPEQSIDRETFSATMSLQIQRMRESVGQVVILSFVYNYRNIELSSLEKYIQFLENPPTRNFNDSVKKGMNSALRQSNNKLANELAVALKKNVKKSKK
ncbi:MAG: DUF2059 domain-containing protein [Chitinivibrionales bacterium]|nr:DUF2059 domain-containing protein [Chitinivibrionales bacterium]